MKFRLQADATFEADNIDDALKKLAEHLLALTTVEGTEGDHDDLFEERSSVRLFRAGVTNPWDEQFLDIRR